MEHGLRNSQFLHSFFSGINHGRVNYRRYSVSGRSGNNRILRGLAYPVRFDVWFFRPGALRVPGGDLYDRRDAGRTGSPAGLPPPRAPGGGSVDPAGNRCVYYLKVRRSLYVSGPNQLVGAGFARLDCFERDYRNSGAVVSQILSGPDRCRGAGDICSVRLGPSPISAPGYTGRHYSKRGCSRVDTKAFAGSSRSRCCGSTAVAPLPFSNLQEAGTALTPRLVQTCVRIRSHKPWSVPRLRGRGEEENIDAFTLTSL